LPGIRFIYAVRCAAVNANRIARARISRALSSIGHMRLDAVRIATENLERAIHAYARLLGVESAEVPNGRRFQLERGAVELVAGAPGIEAVIFAPDGDAWPADATFNGLSVRIETPPAVTSRALAPDAVAAIDHVVAFTPDPERAIALWRDRLGLRLAFDRTFPDRKVRLLFFRSGGLTFEFACAEPPPADPSGPDRFYGVSYRVRDLPLRRATLVAAGIDVSEIRAGNKAGTRVASVRSATEDVPTLEDEARHG
jgi:catechol 2,3-dioxygenase-like lactoylglutathione lyase family enzyme